MGTEYEKLETQNPIWSVHHAPSLHTVSHYVCFLACLLTLGFMFFLKIMFNHLYVFMCV